MLPHNFQVGGLAHVVGRLAHGVGGLAHAVGGLAHVYSRWICSCVVSQLYMFSIPGSIPATYTIVRTGGSVL